MLLCHIRQVPRKQVTDGAGETGTQRYQEDLNKDTLSKKSNVDPES